MDDMRLQNELYQAVLSLKNLDEARRFFRDLLTEEEILEFSKRWQVARLLDADVPYSAIQKQTDMSSTTIARISKWLRSGMGGYALVLKRLGSHHAHPSRSKG